MSRKQGLRAAGMRPAANVARRRREDGQAAITHMEAAE